MSEGEKREAAVELSVTPAEEEETVIKQSTTILEQVRGIMRCRRAVFYLLADWGNSCGLIEVYERRTTSLLIYSLNIHYNSLWSQSLLSSLLQFSRTFI